MYKKALNVVFLILIFLLVGILTYSCFTISGKNSKIEELNAKILENQQLIDNHLKVQAELEEKIAKGEGDLNNIKAQLEASQSEVNRLIEENNSLKHTIEQLQLQNSLTNKVCYLTFDDGPSDNTLKVLDILDRYNVKATFFVIKNSKEDYIKNIAVRGHTVGLHTATHSYPQIYSSDEAYFADLKAISDTVESQIGIKSNIIRFPGGSSNRISSEYCQGIMTRLTKSVVDMGYYYFDWNVDSTDASGNNIRYQVIRDNVLKSARGKGSICVLMHDTSAKNTTVQALPGIIEGLSKMGYRFEALTKDSFGFRHSELNN